MRLLMMALKWRVVWILLLIGIIVGRLYLVGGLGSWSSPAPAFDLAECLFEVANGEPRGDSASALRLRQEARSLYANRRIDTPETARVYIEAYRETAPEFIEQLERDCAAWTELVK